MHTNVDYLTEHRKKVILLLFSSGHSQVSDFTSDGWIKPCEAFETFSCLYLTRLKASEH